MYSFLFGVVWLFSRNCQVFELNNIQASSFAQSINSTQSETRASYIQNTLVLRGSNISIIQVSKQITQIDSRFGSIQTKLTKVLKLKYMYPIEFLNTLQGVMPIYSNLQGTTFSDCVILSGKPEEIEKMIKDKKYSEHFLN